ncbi:MAG: hypothetical protein ACOC2Y_04360 [Spirochaetota bacterium]
MKVVELTNVVQRETPLHYRRTFTATAVFSRNHSRQESSRVEFVLEHSPLGSVGVKVKILDEIDYPLVPAISALKAHIAKLEQSGNLP